MTPASGLRAILRQDPDIVAVGEIRDGDGLNAMCAPPSPATRAVDRAHLRRRVHHRPPYRHRRGAVPHRYSDACARRHLAAPSFARCARIAARSTALTLKNSMPGLPHDLPVFPVFPRNWLSYVFRHVKTRDGRVRSNLATTASAAQPYHRWRHTREELSDAIDRTACSR